MKIEEVKNGLWVSKESESLKKELNSNKVVSSLKNKEIEGTKPTEDI
jgi:hypothetical protein